LLQQQVREGKTSALAAMKFPVTVAHVSTEDCEGMAAAFAQHHCDTGQERRCGTWPDGAVRRLAGIYSIAETRPMESLVDVEDPK